MAYLRFAEREDSEVTLAHGGSVTVELWVSGDADVALLEGRLSTFAADVVSLTGVAWDVTPAAGAVAVVGMTLPADIERAYGCEYVTGGVVSFLPAEPITSGPTHVATLTLNVADEPGSFTVSFAAGFAADGDGELSWLQEQPGLTITVTGE